MASILNPIAFATLLTALFVLRFRGWNRPLAVVGYFVFFAALEIGATRLLPPGAFGPGLGFLCLALAVPVLIAAGFVWRQEKRQDELGE